MLSGVELGVALPSAKLRVVHGPWSRTIGYRHLLGPPSSLAPAFTPKGSFDSIYLADDPITALTEVSALVALPGGPLAVRTAPLVIISADGMVSRVLDLTDSATLALLGTNEQEISGTWVKAPRPPAHLLALAAYDSAAIAGIRYPSAKHPGGVNLVVFPDRLAGSPSDYLEAYDPDRHFAQRLGA